MRNDYILRWYLVAPSFYPLQKHWSLNKSPLTSPDGWIAVLMVHKYTIQNRIPPIHIQRPHILPQTATHYNACTKLIFVLVIFSAWGHSEMITALYANRRFAMVKFFIVILLRYHADNWYIDRRALTKQTILPSHQSIGSEWSSSIRMVLSGVSSGMEQVCWLHVGTFFMYFVINNIRARCQLSYVSEK